MYEQKPTKPCPECGKWDRNHGHCWTCNNERWVPVKDADLEEAGQITMGIER